MGAIITGEKHKGIIVDVKLFEFCKEFADVTIHPCNHCGVALLRLGPVLVLVDTVVGHLHTFPAGLVVGVRDGEGQVQEEGIVPASLNKGQGLFGT